MKKVILLILTILLIVFFLILHPSRSDAIEFKTIRDNMKNMTGLNWDDYSNSLKGEWVNWIGWISDVKKQRTGGCKILIDMDPPGSLSVYDVSVQDFPKASAAQFQKDQKVNFSGIIKSVMKFFGSCTIILENVDIEGY